MKQLIPLSIEATLVDDPKAYAPIELNLILRKSTLTIGLTPQKARRIRKQLGVLLKEYKK